MTMYDDRQARSGIACGGTATSRTASKGGRLRSSAGVDREERSIGHAKNARLMGAEKIRNLSEKKRRDQFNALITDLSSVVSVGNRKMDKSTVMKAAIAFLRNHKEVAARSQAQESQDNWKPSLLPSEEFAHLMLEALDGFIIAFSTNGTILYTSDSVASLLGHLSTDLLNTSIYDLLLSDNRNEVFQLLTACNATWALTPNTECQISFQAFVRRGTVDTTAPTTFELVRFSGRYRRWGQFQATPLQGHQSFDNLTAARSGRSRSGCRDELQSTITESNESPIAVVVTGRLQAPHLLRGITLSDVTKCEFASRHSLEWKFLFLDHRAPHIIGYLPFEVLGTSGYDYYHPNDLERIAAFHEALTHTGEGTSCHYRFLTKGEQWIWLQTRYYITYHQWNSKPEFIVCTNTVVSYTEAWLQLREELTKNQHRSSSIKDLHLLSPVLSSNSRSTNHYRRSPINVRTSIDADPFSLVPPVDSIRQFSHVSLTTQSVTTVCASSALAVTEFPTSPLEVQLADGATSIHLLGASHSPTAVHVSIPNIEITAPIEDEASTPSALYHLVHDQSELHSSGSSPSLLLSESPTLERSLLTTMLPLATYQPVFTMSPTSMMDTDYGIIPSPMVFTPTQVQLHEQLRRKHQVLQETIMRQQEELRLVHEQLMRSQVMPQTLKMTTVQYPPVMDSSGVSFQTTAAMAALFPEANNCNFAHAFPALNLPPTILSAPAHVTAQQHTDSQNGNGTL